MKPHFTFVISPPRTFNLLLSPAGYKLAVATILLREIAKVSGTNDRRALCHPEALLLSYKRVGLW